MSATSCPPHARLLAFRSGDLPAPDLDRIAQHVLTCDDCQTTLASLPPSPDLLVAGLRRLGERDPFVREAQCVRAVTYIEALAPEAATAAPESGQLGQYRLLELLGRGGMGAVYKALHPFLNRAVALKVLPEERMRDSQAVARFRREMEAIGKLQHPNIVQATDAGESDGRHFLVMELVEGCDLSRLVLQRGPLPVADACEAIRQASLGLQHAHEHGLVHRDIKPSNLIVTPTGLVKVLDLGLALLRGEVSEGELTEVGQVMGTLDYMAPEQAFDAHQVDVRADVYSLGCTLYYLLTGQPPYAGRQYRQALKKMLAHAGAPTPELRPLRPDAPEELDALLQRLLAKKPADRLATPQDVATALAPFSAGHDLAALLRPAADPSPVTGGADTVDTTSTARVSANSSGPWPKTSPTEKPNSATHSSPFLPRRVLPWLVAAAAGFLGILWLGGVLVRIETPGGMLVIDADQPGVEVYINGQKATLTVPGEGEPITVEVDEGKHELQVRKGGFETFTKQFTLKAGDKETVKVHLEPLAAAKKKIVTEGVLTLRGHTEGIVCVAFSPDGQRLASGSYDNTVIIWDAWTGQLLHTLRKHTQEVTGVAFSPDSKRIASSSWDKSVKLWDALTGQELPQLGGHLSRVNCVTFSPDGQRLASAGNDGTIRVWDATTSKEILKIVKDPAKGQIFHARCLCYSPDGRRLASGGVSGGAGGDSLLIWDAQTGQKLVPMARTDEHGLVWNIAFSPDGRRLASAHTSPAVWDAFTGQKLFALDDAQVRCIAFSPDGQLVATAGEDAVVKIWDARTRQQLHTLRGHDLKIWALAFSADGQRLASASGDSTVRVWTLQTE